MMPGMNGLDVVKELRRRAPDTEVLIFSIDDSEDLIRETLHPGARGYVLKTDAGAHLVEAVLTISRHEPYLSRELSTMFVKSFMRDGHETAGRSTAGHAADADARSK